MAMPPNTESNLALFVLLTAASCSTLPERSWPPRLVGEIEVVHHIAPGGSRPRCRSPTNGSRSDRTRTAHIEARIDGAFVVPTTLMSCASIAATAFGVAGEAPSRR